MSPCDCSPRCVLRAINPLKIRPARTTSPYVADLATRLAGYAALAHDPVAPIIAPDHWTHSEPYYQTVLAATSALTGAAALHQLADIALRDRIAGLLDRDPTRTSAARHAVDNADANVFLRHFLGAGYQPVAPPIGPARLRSLTWTTRDQVPGGDEVLVVIPFADERGTGKLRNLLACLHALRDQSMPPDRYRITVVECGELPRGKAAIEPLADDYLHIHDAGAFNKPWTINVGVRATLGAARTLCVLDADILPDRDFLARNHTRFDDPDNDAHLPHTDLLALDVPASDTAIGRRCVAGESQAPLTTLRGLLLRDLPGACLWLRPEVFHRVGGFDERNRGGEDEDMLVRVTRAASVVQYDDVFLRLAPRAPAMSQAVEPFGDHFDTGSWTGAYGYGDPKGPIEPWLT